jgi:carboxyl-terminal processing protease
MRTLSSLILIFSLIWTGGMSQIVSAKPAKAPSNIVAELQKKPQDKIVSERDLFIAMVDIIAEYGEIPGSYRSIKIANTGTSERSRLYKAYQKAVYLDILNPSQIPLSLRGEATHKKLVDLTNIFYGEKVWDRVLVDGNELTVINKKLTGEDLVYYASNYLATKSESNGIESVQGYDIFTDVYKKLTTEHFDRAKIEQRDLMYGAIEWLANGTGDKYTTYFPPLASAEFSEEINGEFEWIGAYVSMNKPGEFIIDSPLPRSPALEAWVQAGDRVLKIGDYEITRETSIKTAVSKIKWPAGSRVTVTLLRGGETIVVTIERRRIKIDLVTYKKLSNDTAYMAITSFGSGTRSGFSESLSRATQDGASRLIIDLRNDGGWDLEEVSGILNYFLPAGAVKVRVRSATDTDELFSSGLSGIAPNTKIIFLANKWTASASEILIGTVQDALWERVRVVGETTYGKWSVQSVFPYPDGSSIKYTSAKWFTWPKDRSIDGIGIIPDHSIELDALQIKNGYDTQLEFARNLAF